MKLYKNQLGNQIGSQLGDQLAQYLCQVGSNHFSSRCQPNAVDTLNFETCMELRHSKHSKEPCLDEIYKKITKVL